MRIRLPLLLLPLALAACGEANDTAALPADTTGVVAPADTTAVATAPMDTGMAGMQAAETVDMTALDDSGVTGQVQITPEGAQTRVMVTLNAGAAQANTEHQGHIHQGTCAQLGGVDTPLQPVTLDASGTGSMTTTVALAPDSVMDGRHIVVYHEAGGSPGKPVVCGAIPQHQAM